MLSRKAKYGLKAVLFLAQRSGEGPVLIEEIAVAEGIPRKFLEQILLELKKKGLLHSRMGRGGGYQLGRAPEEIFMGEIVRALDGPLAPVPCVSVIAYRRCDECADENSCGIRLVMKEVRDSIAHILDTASLADVITRMKRSRGRKR